MLKNDRFYVDAVLKHINDKKDKNDYLPSQRLPVITIINWKSFTKVSENQGSVFLDFEMTGHIFPAKQNGYGL